MAAEVIYSLCAVVAFVCSWLLFRAHARQNYRLLFWSGICFAGLTLNNVLLVVDKIFLPATDLTVWRLTEALASLMVLIYGLIWDAD